MSFKHNAAGRSGLQFFGKITASISHEIRNVFAVLNENAGLMEDLILLGEKGMPVDQARLKALAQSMGQQIRRGDGIVENMNRFAHEVDHPVKEIELNETLGLLIALSGRLAKMRGVTIDPVGEEEIMIATNAFFLENLLWSIMEFAMEAVGKDKTLTIVSHASERGVQIRFQGLENLPQIPSDGFPSALEQALLASLEADFSINSSSEDIILTLPKKIEAA